jgi:hypothetical protein
LLTCFKVGLWKTKLVRKISMIFAPFVNFYRSRHLKTKFPTITGTAHSNSKFRVSATEAFRKTTFTEVSSSKILPETSGFRTETSGFRTETSGFSNRNFGFFEPKLWVFQPKLRVFESRIIVFLNQSCSFCNEFFLSYRNFGYWFRDFMRPKLRNIKSRRSFGWTETGKILEVSGENELLCTVILLSSVLNEIKPVLQFS